MKKRLWAWLRKEPFNGFVCLIVFSFHVFTLFWMVGSSDTQKNRPIKPHILVKTIQPKAFEPVKTIQRPVSKPQPKPISKPPVKTPVEKPTPKPQEKTAVSPPKIKTAPPIVEKKIAREKKTTAKKAQPEENRTHIPAALLQDLEETIAKIEEKRDKRYTGKKAWQAPPSPEPLAIDQRESGALDENFRSALVDYLHSTLHLPEYGEVKIELTVRRDGTIVNMHVIKTESEKNRAYLQQELPKLKLPFLDPRIFIEKERSFVFTFCNEV